MIDEILKELINSHGFEAIFANEGASIFARLHGESRRYIILQFTNQLGTVDEVHAEAHEIIPQAMKNDPAFHKNTDLVIAVKIDLIDKFRDLEKQIFSLEEDAHFFKKYVLYYTDAEETLLLGKRYDDLRDILLDKNLFHQYKSSPLMPSLYGIAAKIFIKFPFIELPISENTLTPLLDQSKELVSQLGMGYIRKMISATEDDLLESKIKELINNELEDL